MEFLKQSSAVELLEWLCYLPSLRSPWMGREPKLAQQAVPSLVSHRFARLGYFHPRLRMKCTVLCQSVCLGGGPCQTPRADFSCRQLGQRRRNDWRLSWWPAFEEIARRIEKRAWKKWSESASGSLSCQNIPKQEHPGMTAVTRNHKSTCNWFCKKTKENSNSKLQLYMKKLSWWFDYNIWTTHVCFPHKQGWLLILKYLISGPVLNAKKWTFSYYYSSMTLYCIWSYSFTSGQAPP